MARCPDLRFAFPLDGARAALLAWYGAVRRALPWRQRWAAEQDPYVVWVSEIMLQQTVIQAVIPVYARFLDRFPTVAALAAADDGSVRSAVRGLGYYRRFRFLHAAARELTAKPNWRWPTTAAGWRELPGVGDYTAAAVSSIAFGADAAVVDGNVERVFCRLLDLREAPNAPHLKRAFKVLAATFLAKGHAGDHNQALMELGQTVCTVSAPTCAGCPLGGGCLARERGSQAVAPGPKLKGAAPKDVPMRLVIPLRGGLIGVVPRPANARFLKGTAGFLTGLVDADGAVTLDGWQQPDDWLGGEAVGRIRHSITHHRIDAAVATVTLKGKTPAGTIWVPPADVEERLVSNLDRKAWRALQRSGKHALQGA